MGKAKGIEACLEPTIEVGQGEHQLTDRHGEHLRLDFKINLPVKFRRCFFATDN
jgi:hypothetical protein